MPSHPSLQTSVRTLNGVDALRCFALVSCAEASVLRRSYCLQCCLDLFLISRILFCENSLLQEPDSEHDHRNENFITTLELRKAHKAHGPVQPSPLVV